MSINYRIKARQKESVVTAAQLEAAWAYLGLPLKCPAPEEIVSKFKDSRCWYRFIESTGEYIYVSPTKQAASPLESVLFNKWGRF